MENNVFYRDQFPIPRRFVHRVASSLSRNVRSALGFFRWQHTGLCTRICRFEPGPIAFAHNFELGDASRSACGIPVPLHVISIDRVRTVPYLSNQGDSEAVPYLVGFPGVPGTPHREFRGSSQPFSRSAARISACSPRHRQCPDSTVTGAFNSGHACTGIRIGA